MGNIQARDANGLVIELKAKGTGSNLDPFEYVSSGIGTDADLPAPANGGTGGLVSQAKRTNIEQAAILVALADIKTLLLQQREFGDRMVQDSTSPQPLFVIIRTTINEGTGVLTTQTLNLDGTTFSGSLIAPLSPPDSASGLVSATFKYRALTTNGSNWTINHQLALFKVVRPNGTIAFQSWTNVTKGTSLSVMPLLPAEAEPEDDEIEPLLKQLVAGVNISFLAGTNISVNTGIADTGTQRTICATDSPDVSAIGLTTETAIAANQIAAGSLKSILRGLWGTLLTKSGYIRLTDGITDAKILPSSTKAQSTDPALVVALSPNQSLSLVTPSSTTKIILVANIASPVASYIVPSNAVALEIKANGSQPVFFRFDATVPTTIIGDNRHLGINAERIFTENDVPRGSEIRFISSAANTISINTVSVP
jgi:hypothetical protein